MLIRLINPLPLLKPLSTYKLIPLLREALFLLASLLSSYSRVACLLYIHCVQINPSIKTSVKPSHHDLSHWTVSCKAVKRSFEMAGLKQRSKMRLSHALHATSVVDTVPALLQRREYFFWAVSVLGGIFIPHIDFKTKQSSCCLATPLERSSLTILQLSNPSVEFFAC